MAPKKATPAPAAAAPSAVANSAKPSTAAASRPSRAAKGPEPAALPVNASLDQIVLKVWHNYLDSTPQRAKLIDTFLAFLVVVGALQFLYVLIVGNYPFNAFLAGFSACVGQFVLTASLRIQTNPANRKEFSESFSDERAFADFVFGSLILHFFCINFIN